MEANGHVVIEEESLLAFMRRELRKMSKHRGRGTIRCTIRRVQYDKRPMDDNPYHPKVISIGPFHRDKERLKLMEKRKWRYLQSLLQSSGGDDNDNVLREFIEAARGKEEDARACYHRPETLVDISSDAFVNMLVLDGCFLIKFIIDSRFTKEKVMDDLGWKLSWIKHDILLLENQIPFFVLEALFEVYQRHANTNTGVKSMLGIATRYLCHTELWDRKRNFWTYYVNWEQQIVQSPSHLLHLFHMTLINSQLHKQSLGYTRLLRSSIKFFFSSLTGLVFWPMYLIHQLLFGNPTYPTKIASATELQEAGVKLRASFMDLRFKDGSLFIPIFSLDRQSFSLLKNLIALEIYLPGMPAYILTYSEFLGELIKTPADMEVMQQNQIITAQSHVEGALLVSKLLAGLEFEVEDTLIPAQDFGYWQHPRVRKWKLMKYCENPHHRWRAKLMKDYFGNPWATIGFLVAFLLLVLTVLGTVHALLAYYRKLYMDAKSQ